MANDYEYKYIIDGDGDDADDESDTNHNSEVKSSISRIRKRFICKSRPITKTTILRKINNHILYGNGNIQFVFNTDIKQIKNKAYYSKKKPLLPSFTRNSQEWAFYYSNTTSPHNIRFFMYTLYMMQNINSYHFSKFLALRKHLYNLQKNGMNETSWEYIYLMERIYKMQKYYWTLRRFVMHCQYKHAKVQIEYDLYMNPLIAEDKNTFVLLQEGKLYYFTLTNLSKIIVNALTHHSMFFMQPQIIKNPYNNVELKISDLYNIYFKMKFSGYPISYIFSRFYQVNFDINMFKMRYEYDIKNYAIKSYAENATAKDLVEYAFEMLSMVDINNVWEFDKDFPDEILVRELRPFIKIYLFYSYSLEYRGLYKKHLTEKLLPIIYSNSEFGKKKKEISRFSETPQYNDKLCYPFSVSNNTNYLLCHKYSERSFTIMHNELNRQSINEVNRWGFRRATPIIWTVSRETDRGYLSDEEQNVIIGPSQPTENVSSNSSDSESSDDYQDEWTDTGSDIENSGSDETTVIWNQRTQENTSADDDDDEDTNDDETWHDSDDI